MSKEINDSDDFLARWLSGELTPEEKIKFESSKESDEFKAILDSVDKLSLPKYDVEEELQKLKAKRVASSAPPSNVTKTIRFPQFVRYAVAAVVIMVITFTYFLTRPNYVVFETLAGQVEEITLPDQSVVTLNGNSTLKYNPDEFENNRHLILSGEAFFEVTKGINFEVETSQGNIKVLGTSFNIWNRNKLLDVVCFTGKVNVSKKTYSQDLTPGDGLRVDNGKLKSSWTKVLSDSKPAWILLGVTNLENVTLQEALNELINTFGIEIESNNDLNSIPYNGTFPNNDVETAIKLVLRPSNIDYTFDTASKRLVLKGIKD